jgi:hypothetical protein
MSLSENSPMERPVNRPKRSLKLSKQRSSRDNVGLSGNNPVTFLLLAWKQVYQI